MAIYQLDDLQNYVGELGVNIYHYESSDPAASAFELCEAFEAMVIPQLQQCQSGTCYHVLVSAKNLVDVTDFYTLSLGPAWAGVVGGDPLPTSNCVSIRLNRGTSAVKNGWKRIGGLAEGQIQGNVIASTFLGDFNALAVILGSPISSTSGVVFAPRIARRPDPAVGAWELFPVVSATVKGVGSQVSRKKRFGF